MVSARVEEQLALGGQAQQILSQHPIQSLIETHDGEWRLNDALLDPEGSEAGQAGDAAGGAVGIVEIPDVVDVHAGVKPAQHFGNWQIAPGYFSRLRHFPTGSPVSRH